MTDAALVRALAEARRALIDLSPRNRLLSLPDNARGTGAIGITGEKSESLWRLLVTEGRAMGFSAGVAAPPDAPVTEDAPKKRTRRRKAAAPGAAPAPADPDDLLLTTSLSDETLPRSLLRLQQAASTFLQEQGIPLLFLALGTLAWTDPKPPARTRRAPLLLMPVALSRRTARDAFALGWSGGEIEANETLAVLLADRFGIRLPAAPDFDERAEDGFAAVATWMNAVAHTVAEHGFVVQPDEAALGLFGFAKLLMARDLEHPRIAASPWVAALLGNAPIPASSAEKLADDADLDEAIRIERLDHVVDADASQTRAIERARRGDSLVIQGPPGTGKSQTIANVVAQAVLDGKTVLFVAEKMAALSVVKRRLDAVGIGAACLELHSEKASRAALLAELDHALKQPPVAPPQRRDLIERLGRLRGRLNRYARDLHATVGDTGISAYDAIGRLVLSRMEAPDLPEVTLGAGDWSAADIAERRSQARGLADAASAMGRPADNPWRGVALTSGGPELLRRIMHVLPQVIRAAAGLRQSAAAAAAQLGKPPPSRASEAGMLLAASEAAEAFAAIHARAAGAVPAAWTMPGLAEVRRTIAAGGGFFSGFSASYRAAQATLLAAVPGAPAEQQAQLALLDALLEGQALLRADPLLQQAPVLPAADREALRAAIGEFKLLREAFVDAAALERDELAAFADPPFDFVLDRLSAMAGDPEALSSWVTWRRARADPAMAPLADAVATGRVAPEAAVACFDGAVAAAVWKAACRASPDLATFDPAAHDRTVEEFRELDRARLDLARAEAAAAHGALRPQAGQEVAIIRGEIARKRGHMPIRKLLAGAAGAVQAIKPVFMMSPLSVAQYLDPDALAFDMLVIDEASQVEPVDAIGAIARARQVIVVGDDRQMPPTAFFKAMTSESDEETPEAEVAEAKDVESILSLANARGVPSELLRWHYRSRHQSLIKVSNDAFYDSRLLVIPSPRARAPGLGLSLVRVEGGVFASGGEGCNAIEARAVAEAALNHARESPGDSLGISAFSVSQRDAILDAVEALRRDNPETESFFNGHEDEPFFVKNLENVQGDERDAIFISIGYAPDAQGTFAMRFGPLSMAGGERRLNVLITRAKKRCAVFSSISADQIDLARASGRGVAVLKEFLAYAAAGASGAAADSIVEAADPFTRAVQLSLARQGIATRARVGLSGLFLDLAVADGKGEDFALGLAADGPFYVLARGARDRDRQRDAALAMMGWKMARTWSSGWLARPDAEAASLAARAREAAGIAPPVQLRAPAPAPLPGLSVPYAPAVLEVPKDTPIPQVPFARLAAIAAEIVRAESPVHQEGVVLRLCALWGTPPDAAIRAAVLQALRLAKELEGLFEQGGFLTDPAAAAVVRDRSALPVPLRRAAMVAPAEWRAAVLALVAASPGLSRAQLEAGVPRLLGIEGGEAAASAQVALLEGAGVVLERGGGMVAG